MKIMFSYLICLLLCYLSISQAIQCKGSAKYKLTFKGEWTRQSHPQDFPSSNPHFSSLVGCSHNASYVMWQPGMNATTGVKRVAELGNTDNMIKEIDAQISLKTALVRFIGFGILNTGSRVIQDIQVNTNHSLVSAISMIAPSPDWFVGVRDYNLCNETTGKWIEKRVRNLPLYDSGTDSAPSFVHSDTPTNPPVPIFIITHIPEGSTSNETLKRFGRFTFEKTHGYPTYISVTIPNHSTSKAKSTTMSPSAGNTSPSAGNTSPSAGNTSPSAGSTSPSAGNTSPSAGNASPSAGNASPSAGNTSPSAGSTSTTKPSTSGASSVVQLGAFAFLNVIIFNLFFKNIQ